MMRRLPPGLAVRILWIAIRLLVVFWFGERGLAFYYQGF